MIRTVSRSLDWIAEKSGVTPELFLCVALPALRGYVLALPGETYQTAPETYRFLGDVPEDLNGNLLILAGVAYLILLAIGKKWPRVRKPLLMVRLISGGAFMGFYGSTGIALHRALPGGGAWPWYFLAAFFVSWGMIRVFVEYFGTFTGRIKPARRVGDMACHVPTKPSARVKIAEELRKLDLVPPKITAR